MCQGALDALVGTMAVAMPARHAGITPPAKRARSARRASAAEPGGKPLPFFLFSNIWIEVYHMPLGILTVTIETNMDMYPTNQEAIHYLLDQLSESIREMRNAYESASEGMEEGDLGEIGATWSFEVAD
jgi:hypothetical protein